MNNETNKRVSDEALMQMVVDGAQCVELGVDAIRDGISTRGLAEMATEILAARRRLRDEATSRSSALGKVLTAALDLRAAYGGPFTARAGRALFRELDEIEPNDMNRDKNRVAALRERVEMNEPETSSDPTTQPDNVGYDGTYVSGPLRSTEQIAAEYATRDSYTLCLYWRERDDGVGGQKVYWVDFELFRVLVVLDDGAFLYERRGSGTNMGLADALTEAEIAASGFVKWDGCTQFDFGNLLHVDSKSELDDLLRAVTSVRRRCAQVMPWSDVALEYGIS